MSSVKNKLSNALFSLITNWFTVNTCFLSVKNTDIYVLQYTQIYINTYKSDVTWSPYRCRRICDMMWKGGIPYTRRWYLKKGGETQWGNGFWNVLLQLSSTSIVLYIGIEGFLFVFSRHQLGFFFILFIFCCTFKADFLTWHLHCLAPFVSSVCWETACCLSRGIFVFTLLCARADRCVDSVNIWLNDSFPRDLHAINLHFLVRKLYMHETVNSFKQQMFTGKIFDFEQWVNNLIWNYHTTDSLIG